MAIWTPSQGAATNAGADGGTLFKGSANGSRVIQSKVTPANAQARAGFAQWGRLAYWQDLWLGVGGQLQGQWNTYAAANPDYGLTGRAVIKSGADHFASYWNRAELMTGAEPSPPYSTPDPDPIWNAPSAPFEEFLVGSPLFSMVLATTQPDPITLFLAVRQPSKGKGNMARSTQRPLGSYTFPTMTQGDLFDTACIDAAQRFGAIADSQAIQQWFTVWQAIGGYARPLLDPCWTPPPPTPGPSYTLTMVSTLSGTTVKVMTETGAPLSWMSADEYARLDGHDMGGGLFTWTCSCIGGEPPIDIGFGTLESTVLPPGNYTTDPYYITSIVIV
jgi:hypothetical protein